MQQISPGVIGRGQQIPFPRSQWGFGLRPNRPTPQGIPTIPEEPGASLEPPRPQRPIIEKECDPEEPEEPEPKPCEPCEIDYEKLVERLKQDKAFLDMITGPPGKDGTNGADGIDGAPGAPGKDAELSDEQLAAIVKLSAEQVISQQPTTEELAERIRKLLPPVRLRVVDADGNETYTTGALGGGARGDHHMKIKLDRPVVSQ